MNKKSVKLLDDEEKLEKSIEAGKFSKVKNDKSNYKEIVKATKDRINLRLDGPTLLFFENLSKREGIPYQTLINNVLHKYVTGELIDLSLKTLNQKIDTILDEVKSLKKTG